MVNFEQVELALYRAFPGLRFSRPDPTPFQPVFGEDGVSTTNKLMAVFTWKKHTWTAMVDMSTPPDAELKIEVQTQLKYWASR